MSVEAQSAAAATIAGTSGVATILTAMGEVSTAVLGVPLPVLLAAMTGAWVARSYTPAKSFFAALAGTVGWMMAGCMLVPLAHALLKHFLKLELPTNALAGLALVVSAGLPLTFPIIVEKVREIVRARLDKLKGG